MIAFIEDAYSVLVKDLKIEWRTRSTLGQVLPFAFFVLVFFGFTFNSDQAVLKQVTPGLIWMVVLFVTIVAAENSLRLETEDEAVRVLLIGGVLPAAIFVGKVGAVVLQLLFVELVLVPGAVVFYASDVESLPLVVVASVGATIGLATVGCLLSTVVVGVKARRTVLPILFMPLVSPVLIAATRAFGDAFGVFAVNGWSWTGLLVLFAIVNSIVGAIVYSQLLEDL